MTLPEGDLEEPLPGAVSSGSTKEAFLEVTLLQLCPVDEFQCPFFFP